jgi:hypothetical protein
VGQLFDDGLIAVDHQDLPGASSPVSHGAASVSFSQRIAMESTQNSRYSAASGQPPPSSLAGALSSLKRFRLGCYGCRSVVRSDPSHRLGS